MIFKGKITQVKEVRELKNGASIDFEVTESEPRNADYPQIALFNMYKGNEYIKYVNDFKENSPEGSLVEVEFNMKKSTYTKDDEERSFYSNSVFKVEVLEKVDLPF